jgi:hypothetical protein
VWKIACFFCIMLLATYIQYDDDSNDPVGNLFYLFETSFAPRNINVTEVRVMLTGIQKKIICLKVRL